MTKLSKPAPAANDIDRITTQIVAAQKEADAARTAKKAAKAAFREAKKRWKEARRAAKAAKEVVKELKAELSVWAIPDFGRKRSHSVKSSKQRTVTADSKTTSTVGTTNGAAEH